MGAGRRDRDQRAVLVAVASDLLAAAADDVALAGREIEEPIACAIPVGPDVPLVVTEGNYLLVPEGPWAEVRELLDEAWFVAPEETLRVDWLIARHIAFGKPPDVARAWSLSTDQRNADLVATTRARADVVVRLP